MNPLYNTKQKLFLPAGALFICLGLFFFSFIPLSSAITWNIDVLFTTANNTIYWNNLSIDFLNDTFYNKSEIDNLVLGNITVNLANYVPYTGATDNLDLGSYNISAGNLNISNINVSQNIYVDGNVTASYFFGDGSGLTNVSGTSLDNGYYIHFNSSIYNRVVYNLSAGDIDRVKVATEPGRKFIYGETFE